MEKALAFGQTSMKRLRLIWQKEARKKTISHVLLVSKFTIKILIFIIPKLFKDMEDKDFSNKNFRIDFRWKGAQNHQWFLFLSFFLGLLYHLHQTHIWKHINRASSGESVHNKTEQGNCVYRKFSVKTMHNTLDSWHLVLCSWWCLIVCELFFITEWNSKCRCDQ